MKKCNLGIDENRDVDTLAHIIRESHRDVAERFELSPENCPRHPSNCASDWIKDDLDRGVRYFTVGETGNPMGCVAVEHAEPHVCYLERLSVLPGCRNRGLGVMLVGHALDIAAGLGAREMSIGIIAEFTELGKWYEKLGFVQGETREFSHLPFGVLMMRLIFKPGEGE